MTIVLKQALLENLPNNLREFDRLPKISPLHLLKSTSPPKKHLLCHILTSGWLFKINTFVVVLRNRFFFFREQQFQKQTHTHSVRWPKGRPGGHSNFQHLMPASQPTLFSLHGVTFHQHDGCGFSLWIRGVWGRHDFHLACKTMVKFTKGEILVNVCWTVDLMKLYDCSFK